LQLQKGNAYRPTLGSDPIETDSEDPDQKAELKAVKRGARKGWRSAKRTGDRQAKAKARTSKSEEHQADVRSLQTPTMTSDVLKRALKLW
jgi:hypothetical protein